jgi:hypothetical protein
MKQDKSNDISQEEEKVFSGRFPVRMPRYLHRQLTLVAREQGVSLSQFVSTAAVMAAGLNGVVSEGNETRGPGWNRVSAEEYTQIWERHRR